MSDEEISKLNRKRGTIKAKLTSFATFLTEMKCDLEANVNVSENIEKLITKLEKQESLWVEFETVQMEIEYVTPEERIGEQYQIRETYYNDYTKGLAQAKVLLNSYDENRCNKGSVASECVDGRNCSVTENSVREIRLL
ncbi:hypothetical protein QE152_g30688 [Popillia japonica]|uniref:Uncharacterized protein n=1 Tax=Popillia japonica TaxID=7064 RepID=A0AAW1JDX8_POPJA